MLVENATIGSDVEFFLRDKTTHEIVSAEGHIPGTKYKPARFDPSNRFWAVQLDNVLAEGNIPPASQPTEFADYITRLRQYIDSLVADKNLETIAIAAARLDDKYLQTENAKIFGCDPSFNCWTKRPEQPKPKPGDNLRSAGFHIHVGYTAPEPEANLRLAQMLDLALGLPSVLLEPPSDRKKVGYGKAGNFRHQPHGVEYRTLSSYFASDRRLIEWAYRNTIWAVEQVNDLVTVSPTLGETVQGVINTDDRNEAQKLVSRLEIPMVA